MTTLPGFGTIPEGSGRYGPTFADDWDVGIIRWDMRTLEDNGRTGHPRYAALQAALDRRSP